MKVLIQVVNNASVTIDNKIFSKIEKGLLLFVGFADIDTKETVEKMAKKVVELRIFKDAFDKTNLSINDVNGEILSISQFTLYANTRNGRRPDFIEAAKGEKAKELYEYFNGLLTEKVAVVKTGIFGADMKVKLENDGPFTIMLDSKVDIK